jgi:hypothetical protein
VNTCISARSNIFAICGAELSPIYCERMTAIAM